jgi:hypothetical protein
MNASMSSDAQRRGLNDEARMLGPLLLTEIRTNTGHRNMF